MQKGKIIKKRTLKRMYQTIKLSTGKDYKVTPVGHYKSVHGLGWEVAKDNSHGKIVYHTGAEPGTKSYFLRNVDKDRLVVVMTNNYLTQHQSCFGSQFFVFRQFKNFSEMLSCRSQIHKCFISSCPFSKLTISF